MAELFPLASTLAQVFSANNQPSFELAFSQLQNTIIRRINDEIERVTEEASTDRNRIEKLQRDGLKLSKSLPAITAYRKGNFFNQGQLDNLIDQALTLADSLGPDDAVDAAEVAAFNAQRDIVVDLINEMPVYIHPNIVDGKTIQRLKDQRAILNGLAPAVGSKSGLAANIAATDAVTALQDELAVALTVTQNTVQVAVRLELSIQRQQFVVLAEFTELTDAEVIRRNIEIDNIKIDFANILTAISLSFEGNKTFAAELNKFLVPFRPEPGSVLNLFT